MWVNKVQLHAFRLVWHKVPTCGTSGSVFNKAQIGTERHGRDGQEKKVWNEEVRGHYLCGSIDHHLVSTHWH